MKQTQQSRVRALTQAQMVLLAMYRASGGSTTKVAYEELVLQAWRDYPEVFSLRNHPEHPDASDIHKRLYQTLKSDSLAVSLGNKFFRLTEKGLQTARNLISSPSTPVKQEILNKCSVRLSREEEAFIRHALNSRAYIAWTHGEAHQLVDYDARLFFRFSVSTSVNARTRLVRFARDAIDKAKQIGIEGADVLDAISEFLTSEFSELFTDWDKTL